MSLNRHPKLILTALTLLFAAYLVQMFSPLRLNTDAIIYLLLAGSAADHNGFLYHGHRARFPPGYPAMLAGLDRAGLGASWAFIGLNCFLLASGLAACYVILRRAFRLERATALLLCCLTLLSYLFVKHVTIPLSDIPFFGVATVCLLALVSAERQEGLKHWGLIAIAGGLALAAVSIRTIGITLVPAVLWACLTSWRALLPSFDLARRKTIVIVMLAVLALAGVSAMVLVVARSAYFGEALGIYRDTYVAQGLVGTIKIVLDYQLTLWGEITTNIPGSKLPASLQNALPLIGAIALGLTLFGIWLKRRSSGPVEVFILMYMLMLLTWPSCCWSERPYAEARLWLPVMPLLMGWLTIVYQHTARSMMLKSAVAMYLVFFALMGVIALGYSTRISLSGARFPELYGGDDRLRSTYRAAFNRTEAIDFTKTDPDVLGLLRRYEPRASSVAKH